MMSNTSGNKEDSVYPNFNNFTVVHNHEHENIWRHIHNIESSISGEGSNVGIRTEVELLKATIKTIVDNEKTRKLREWSIISGVSYLIIVEVIQRIT